MVNPVECILLAFFIRLKKPPVSTGHRQSSCSLAVVKSPWSPPLGDKQGIGDSLEDDLTWGVDQSW